MIIGENVSHQRIVAAISQTDLLRIRDYIKGSVYCWCKNNQDNKGGNTRFTANDLFGGLNSNWHDTPLQILTDWHSNDGAQHPGLRAWKDLRYILMKVIADDSRRSFRTDHTEKGRRTYLWTGIDSHKPENL